MFGFGKKPGPGIGLNVNSEFISLIKLDKTKRGLEVVNFASQPTPDNCVRDGLIVDADEFGARLKELFDLASLKVPRSKCYINVAIPGQSVVIRLLPVPTGMPSDELADVVRQEAINHVPFPLEEANLDWSVMFATEREEDDGVNRVDVIIAAIQKSIVDSYWHSCQIAGLRLGTVSVSSLAAINALALSGYLLQDNRLTMSVNTRHDGTDISIIKNGMPLFCRSVALGVDALVESISRSLDIPASQSRQLIPQAPLIGVTTSDQRLMQVAQISRTIIGDISDEVGRSIEFYRSQFGEVSISQITLSGIACEVPGLDRFFSSRLNIDCLMANVFREALDSPMVDQARLSVDACSLGVTCDEQWLPIATPQVNLNREGPPLVTAEGIAVQIPAYPVETPWFAPLFTIGVLLLAFLIGIWLYVFQFDLPNKQTQLTKLETTLQASHKQLTSLPELSEDRDALLHKKSILESIVKHENPWSRVLADISQSCPDGLQTKKLEASSHSLTIEGQAVDFARISHFAINLTRTGLTSNVSIETAKRGEADPRVIDFAIHASITNPQNKATQSPTKADNLAASKDRLSNK